MPSGKGENCGGLLLGIVNAEDSGPSSQKQEVGSKLFSVFHKAGTIYA